MTILVTKSTPLILDPSQKISQGSFQQAKTTLQGLVLQPKLNYGKSQPLPVRKEIHLAKLNLLAHGKLLKHNKTDSETFKEKITEKALSFNKTEKINGKTIINPIGLMALARIHRGIPSQVLKDVKMMAVEKTVNTLQQDYIKQQLLQATPKKQEPKPTAEMPLTHETPHEAHPAVETTVAHKVETPEAPLKEVKVENTAPVESTKVEEEPEIAEKTADVQTSPAIPASETEEIILEETAMEERISKPRSADTSSRLSFWQKFSNFFKTIFEWIARLFTGNKKEENQ